MDVTAAQLTNAGNMVQLVDPGFPWTVDVYLADGTARPEIRGLTIWARDEEQGHPITGAVLTALPLRQIASVAASALRGEGETQYRMLAQPRPYGVRSWPEDHFRRVAMVASWARRIGRPGGAAGAVAEFWGVHHRTARRWIAESAGERSQRGLGSAGVPDVGRPLPRTP
jgi:hypothetical protein